MTKQTDKIVFRLHAIERMFQRAISHDNALQALANGEVIEDYPTDTPYPSRLILGVVSGRPLHLVVATDVENNLRIIVTVYEPDPTKWDSGFRRRKQ